MYQKYPLLNDIKLAAKYGLQARISVGFFFLILKAQSNFTNDICFMIGTTKYCFLFFNVAEVNMLPCKVIFANQTPYHRHLPSRTQTTAFHKLYRTSFNSLVQETSLILINFLPIGTVMCLSVRNPNGAISTSLGLLHQVLKVFSPFIRLQSFDWRA